MSIRDETVKMNAMFIDMMVGNTYKDWEIVGGEINAGEDDNIEIIVGVEFSPYAYNHSELYNRKLYTKIVENFVDEIERADDNELNNMVEHLNTMVQDNVDMSAVREMTGIYLKGAHDYQYSIWCFNPNTEINKSSERIKIVIDTICIEGDYFIFEDLALIRAGLDDKISNSPHYGERSYTDRELDFTLDDDLDNLE